MKIIAGYYNGKRISHGWLNGAIIRFLGEITDVDFDYSATTEVQFDSNARPTLVIYLNSTISTDVAESLAESSAKAHSVGYTPFESTFLGESNLQESVNAHTVRITPLEQNNSNEFDLQTFANGIRIAVVITQYKPQSPDTLKCETFARALIAGIVRDFTLEITTAIQIQSTASGTIVNNLNISEIFADLATAEIEDFAAATTLGIVDKEIHTDYAVAESESTAVGNTVDMSGVEMEYKGDVETLSVECFASAEINRTAYLTFTGLNSNFTLETENHTKNWDGKLEYSTDASDWTEWDGTTPIRSYNKKLYLSGINNTFITGDSEDSTKRFVLSGDNEITCKGNLLSLLDYNHAISFEATQDITVAPAAFAYLFYNNANLISAPYMVKVDLTNSDYCYKCTYYGTGVRSIDRTRVKRGQTEFDSGFVFDGLSNGCFWSMFEGSKIRQLSDTLAYVTSIFSDTMGQYSFYRTFANCTELVQTLRIVRTKFLAAYCCASMYEGCVNLTTTRGAITNQTIPTGGYLGGQMDGAPHALDSMFKGCIRLSEISDIDFVQGTTCGGLYGTFSEYMCKSMFEGCVSLTRIPIVITRYASATKNYGDHCFDSALKGCTGIKLSTTSSSTYQYQYTIPNKTTGTTYATSLTDMFAGTGGTFTGTPSFGVTYYTAEPSYGYIKVSIYDGDTLYDYGNTPNPYYTQIPNASHPSISIPALSTYLPQKQGYFFNRWNDVNGTKVRSINQDTNLYIGWSDQADMELDMDYTTLSTSYIDQTFRFRQSAAYTLIVDWGDGSAQSVSSDANDSDTYVTHRYETLDKYTIKVRGNTASSTVPTWQPGGHSSRSCLGAYNNQRNTTLTEVRLKNGTNLTNYGSPNYAWGFQAFMYSDNLKKVAFSGSGFKSCGYSTFNICPQLNDVTLLEGMQVIGDHSFASDRGLTSIILPSTVTLINDWAFYYCTSLLSVNIPNNVTTIGAYAFYYCTSLPIINIPNGVTSIGDYAFGHCTSLTSITIPNGVTSISNYTFGYCNLLVSIDIGSDVTSIGFGAFAGCIALTYMTCRATTPPVLYSDALSDVPMDCNIYVPAESVNAYKSATNWSARSAYIQAIT